ncbi:MAG: hypothetical protein K2L54_03460 [Clostridiales bacterium]|nr:hypothetical protein [Clostridiales bacterium]
MSKHNDSNADAPETAGDYGKFNTADDLLAAYNALESEFTKKCQSVKRLQAQLELLNAQAAQRSSDGGDGACEQFRSEASAACGSGESHAIDESVGGSHDDGGAIDATDAPQSDTVVAAVAVEPDDRRCADEDEARRVLDIVAQNAAEFAETLSALPEIMDACVARYKQKLIGGRTLGIAPSGMAVVAPAKRPRSLYEAKLLADELLGGL